MAFGVQASIYAAIRGASLLILFQIVLRIFTFCVNQTILRFLSAQQLGLATQLEVYYLSVLFFTRESLRVAIQRAALFTTGEQQQQTKPPSQQQQQQQQQTKNLDQQQKKPLGKFDRHAQAIINLAYLPLLASLLVAPVLAFAYYRTLPAAQAQDVAAPLAIHALACVLELLSEPGFALVQSQLNFTRRVAFEAAAAISRCGATLVWVLLMSPTRQAQDGHLDVFPFAVGQLAYSVVLLLCYGVYGTRAAAASDKRLSILPRAAFRDLPADFHYGLFHRPTVSLTSSMAAQSVVKHVLTQGDTLLVSVLSTPEAQGVYALVNNYGGLFSRLIFQPIEESSRGYFGRFLASSLALAADDKNPARYHKAVRHAFGHLQFLLKALVLFSMPVIALGPLAASPLLSLVAGSRWVDAGAGSALATYCYFLPLLAINGVAESFVSSVATRKQVLAQSLAMAAFSVLFAASGFVVLRVLDMGARGLVLANVVNMACRIAWSARFIINYFRGHDISFRIRDLLPSDVTMWVCFMTPTLAPYMIGENLGAWTTLSMVGLTAIPLGIILTFAELPFLLQLFAAMRGIRLEDEYISVE